MATTETLDNALAFARADKHQGDIRAILAQALAACRTLADECERLREVQARLKNDLRLKSEKLSEIVAERDGTRRAVVHLRKQVTRLAKLLEDGLSVYQAANEILRKAERNEDELIDAWYDECEGWGVQNAWASVSREYLAEIKQEPDDANT